MRTLIVMMALLTAGCAKTGWYNPNVTQARAERDGAECDYQANLASPNNPLIARFNLFPDCMRLRGYREN